MNLNQPAYTVYILTNESRNVLYTGMTNDLYQRVGEHYLDREERKTFAGKYRCFWLIYFETYDYPSEAISREKQIKGWTRKRKMDLIKDFNPTLRFMNEEVFGKWPLDDVVHRKERNEW
ncbi:MAG TPA: GIY-YIG nuclease family protein [Chitinophagaceae bacterium]